MPVANEARANFRNVAEITVAAGAAVTGKRFCRISANKNSDGLIVVQHANSGTSGNIVGVSMRDAASGEVFPVLRKGEVAVTAGESLNAGDVVGSSATGTAVRLATIGAGAVRLGVVTADAANAADAFILLDF